MNAKRAKRLRREAREETVGMPDRLLTLGPRGGMLINALNSTRGRYRELKRAAHKGNP